jgi:5-methylthioadenosine/S-adenosylhomocysteine deaminase
VGESLLVEGGHLLRPDSSLERLDVLIDDGDIAAVGPDLDAPEGAEVLDATAMIVAPGLINAHMHSGENFNPGLYENLPLDVWFVHSHQVTRREPLSRQGIYVRTLLGAALMLRSGTTYAVDFLYEAPEITLDTLEPVVQGYRDAGMRATILLGVADKPFAASLPLDDSEAASAREAPAPSRDRIMRIAHEAVDRFHEPDGLIGIGLGPSAPQRCTPELLEATLELARSRGLAWQTHVLETKTQLVTARQWHGKSFVEVLAEHGMLGPETALVHTVWLTDTDIELMSSRGAPSVHCLLSNLRMGDGVARLPALRTAGVRVALGTDGRGCDETLDMLELAKMTASVHKVRGGDYRKWPTAREALDMCTSEASICTGHGERLGRVEPGARGDLVLFPMRSPSFVPLHDPVRQLVYGAASREVDTAVVNGHVVVRGGKPLGFDLDDVLGQAPRYAAESLAGDRGADAEGIESVVAAFYERADRAEVEIDSYLPS